MRHVLGWLLSGLLTVTITIGCSKRGSQSATHPMTIQIFTEPPTLDWGRSVDAVSADILFNIMDGLTQLNDKMEPVPGLAESWKVSTDGTKYTFKIRQGVKWSDGVPLTAQHFVDAWLRLFDPNTASEYAYILYDVRGAKEFSENKGTRQQVAIKAVDASTFEVILKKPASYFLALAAFWPTFPARIDVINKHGDNWHDAGKTVTLGPYLLTEWLHDASLTLKANPDYWGGVPPIKEVKFVVVTENTTAVALFETGKVDLVRAEIPPVDMPRFEGKPELKTGPFFRNLYFTFNVTKKPFDDVRVRKAFAHAVDKTIFPKILKQGQIPSKSWIPQGMMAHNPDIGLDFNPELAKKYLAEAGFPDGKGFPANVAINFDTRDELKMVSESLQEQLKRNLNISLPLENMEWKVYLKLLHTDAPPFFKSSWQADYPDPDNFMSLYYSFSGQNYSRWKNAKFDEIVSKAASTSDTKKRIELYNQAQKIMHDEDTMMIPLYQQRMNLLVSSRIKKSVINAMNILYLKYWEM